MENATLYKNGMYICNFCKKEYCKKGIGTHIWRNHKDGKNFDPNKGYKTKNRKIWNKGLTKKIDIRINNYSESISKTCKEKVKNGTYIKTGFAAPTDEFRRKNSERMSLHNPGGKSKWYEIDGKKVQGGWEKDFALKLNEFDIKWERCKPIIYKKDEKEKRYTPDFYLPIFDKFIEIKGFWWGDDKEKMRLVLEQNTWLTNKIFIIEKKLFNEIKNYTKQELIRTLS